VNNTIDIRRVIANIINVHSDAMDGDHLASIIVEMNNIAVNNYISTDTMVKYLKNKIRMEETDCMQRFYADTLAYVNYISGKAIDDILAYTKPVSLCQKRNLDICSMYCDGYDTSCEMYKSCDDDGDVFIGTCSRFEEDNDTVAIEVCSFEEGDPQ
jgi:hypothetical protein